MIHKPRKRAVVPVEPTRGMLMALAGEPVLLAASDEQELRRRYAAMLAMSPFADFRMDWRKPYLLDTPEKVRWAKAIGGHWRLGDHCPYVPVKGRPSNGIAGK